jgi:hypothetical protein
MKGRPIDLKHTSSTSRALDRKTKKALMARERRQGTKACKGYQSAKQRHGEVIYVDYL